MRRISACVLVALTAQTAAATAATLSIEYIAHASFRLHATDGSSLVIDPYADRIWLSYDYPQGIVATAWLVSHPHYDHDGGDYRGADPPWPDGARVLRFPGEFEVGAFKVTGIKGRHAEPYGEEFGRFNTVWKIGVDGISIAHWGDNEPASDDLVEALGEVDVLMLPIDGVEHLISFKAVDEIVRRVRPKILIPMHYRLPDLEPSEDTPQDLGGIDAWLADRDGVRVLENHLLDLTVGDLPANGTAIYVFQHSPAVTPPAD